MKGEEQRELYFEPSCVDFTERRVEVRLASWRLKSLGKSGKPEVLMLQYQRLLLRATLFDGHAADVVRNGLVE